MLEEQVRLLPPLVKEVKELKEELKSLREKLKEVEELKKKLKSMCEKSRKKLKEVEELKKKLKSLCEKNRKKLKDGEREEMSPPPKNKGVGGASELAPPLVQEMKTLQEEVKALREELKVRQPNLQQQHQLEEVRQPNLQLQHQLEEHQLEEVEAASKAALEQEEVPMQDTARSNEQRRPKEVPDALIHIIADFLRNRRFCVKEDGCLSRQRKFKDEFRKAQYWALTYIVHILQIFQKLTSPAIGRLQRHVHLIEEWFQHWRLTVNTMKSQVIAFSRTRSVPKLNSHCMINSSRRVFRSAKMSIMRSLKMSSLERLFNKPFSIARVLKLLSLESDMEFLKNVLTLFNALILRSLDAVDTGSTLASLMHSSTVS
ncbi:hypothetical protein ANN_00296 [Periplaneta americana]|uniref:Uncharacterized protein n=1 Tax=Periplaneta americana TaxID=6978 RepID=A0ABQ8TQN3_PERAM|nr:hypothetical protein ANN_00296 [Periplaneta americana]